MLKQRIEAADAISRAIRPAEASMEIAAIEASRLVTTMMEARRKANVGGHVGADALALATRASSLVIEAQNVLLEAHRALAPVVQETGLAGREHMYGCEDPPADGPGPSFTRVLFGRVGLVETTSEAEPA